MHLKGKPGKQKEFLKNQCKVAVNKLDNISNKEVYKMYRDCEKKLGYKCKK